MLRLLLAALALSACDGPAPEYCFDRGSQCGCSGHNKSECEDDECCDWVTGDGCECG